MELRRYLYDMQFVIRYFFDHDCGNDYSFLNMLFGKDVALTSNPGFHLSKDGIANYFKYLLSDFIAAHDNNKVYGLVFVCLIVVFSTLFKNLFLYISKYMLHPLRNDIVLHIREELFQKVVHLPIGFLPMNVKGIFFLV